VEQDVVPLEEFQARVADDLALSLDDLPLDATLEELGFDSLMRLDLLASMDELGLFISTDLLLRDDVTIGQLYDVAVSACA
jgi:hypothetical protein